MPLTGLFAADGRLGSELVNRGAVTRVQYGAQWVQYLEGDVYYRVRTDRIKRLRFGSITSLPNRIPSSGPRLRYINPFTLLEGIEPEATVQGNAFRKKCRGQDRHRGQYLDSPLICRCPTSPNAAEYL